MQCQRHIVTSRHLVWYLVSILPCPLWWICLLHLCIKLTLMSTEVMSIIIPWHEWKKSLFFSLPTWIQLFYERISTWAKVIFYSNEFPVGPLVGFTSYVSSLQSPYISIHWWKCIKVEGSAYAYNIHFM